MLESHFNKVEKETPTQVFFYKNCEIFKNTYFEEDLRTTTSVDCCVFAGSINFSVCDVIINTAAHLKLHF